MNRTPSTLRRALGRWYRAQVALWELALAPADAHPSGHELRRLLLDRARAAEADGGRAAA
ncbi:hypothetical protein [Geodermatophilus sp. SYSU D00815]